MNSSFVVRSGRLYLTEVILEDVSVFHDWFWQSNPQMMSCRPYKSREEFRPEDAFDFWQNSDFRRSFSMKLARNDELVGRINYFDFNPRNMAVEIGYMVSPEHRENGLATEGVSLLLYHLFVQLEIHKVMAQTGAFNEPSVALLKKLGFTQDGCLREHHSLDGDLHDDLIFSILAKEYRIPSNLMITER